MSFPAFALPPGIETPAAVVDLDATIRNIEQMQAAMDVAGVALRPHAKTHSSTSVARLQLDRGARGLTAGTLRMAQRLAAGGVDDVLVAAPVWAVGADAQRLRELHDTISLTVGLDSPAAAETLAAAVAGARRPLHVLIEVDCGERRSGVAPQAAGELAAHARRCGLDVAGAFTHGGHGYASPGTGPRAATDEVTALARAAESLGDAGFDATILSAGSTPTARHSARRPVTELRPGTYVFCDRQQVELAGVGPSDVALAVAARVISTAVDGQFILDCGAKALGKDRPEWLHGHGIVPAVPGALITNVFDFHAVVEVPSGAQRPSLGELVTVIPNHVCAAVNLACELVVLRSGATVDRWPIDARG